MVILDYEILGKFLMTIKKKYRQMKKINILIVVIFFSTQLLFSQKFDNLALTPPMGWNSWNKFGCDINEGIVRRMADALVENGLADIGYEYVNVDDCWQTDRDKDGNIVVDSIKFPSGMKALADYVHSRGLKFGLYSCVGDKTCQGKPGSRGHEYQDAKMYASWGVDFLKHDFCYHDNQNAEATYKTMRDALYAAKRPIVFSICESGINKPWLWGKDVGHLWRTSADIKDCADCKYDTGAHGWLNILDQQAPLWRYAGPGHWNDPDMLEVGNGGMTFYENRSHFTMWCMLAAPLILGNDLSNISKETMKIISNKELIAIDQDSLGKQAYRCLRDDEIEIWVKQLSGHRLAVALLNRSKNVCNYRFNWNLKDLTRNFTNWTNEGSYRIHNVWDDTEMGTTEKSFDATLKDRDVILLLLSKN